MLKLKHHRLFVPIHSYEEEIFNLNLSKRLMCLADDALLHLRVSVSLVVDLVQDDHPIGGQRLLPCDVHRIFRHIVLDGTRNVISLVCGRQESLS